jgi:TctA family transporter
MTNEGAGLRSRAHTPSVHACGPNKTYRSITTTAAAMMAFKAMSVWRVCRIGNDLGLVKGTGAAIPSWVSFSIKAPTER